MAGMWVYIQNRGTVQRDLWQTAHTCRSLTIPPLTPNFSPCWGQCEIFPNSPFAESAFLLRHHKARQLSTALKWGGTKQRNPETLSTGKSKELQQHKTRCKEESLWKCMRCEKLTGQLKVLKYNQRLCHCRALLFSTLLLFPLPSIPQSILLIPQPATTAHTTDPPLLALCLCTNRLVFTCPEPADGISAPCVLLLKEAREFREPAGSWGCVTLL